MLREWLVSTYQTYLARMYFSSTHNNTSICIICALNTASVLSTCLCQSTDYFVVCTLQFCSPHTMAWPSIRRSVCLYFLYFLLTFFFRSLLFPSPFLISLPPLSLILSFSHTLLFSLSQLPDPGLLSLSFHFPPAHSASPSHTHHTLITHIPNTLSSPLFSSPLCHIHTRNNRHPTGHPQPAILVIFLKVRTHTYTHTRTHQHPTPHSYSLVTFTHSFALHSCQHLKIKPSLSFSHPHPHTDTHTHTHHTHIYMALYSHIPYAAHFSSFTSV